MLSSTLNPKAINRNSPASFESFGNFMLGENYNKSLDISNAANKIVNFNRTSVSPITPDINSLISNISTNILNQTNNSIKNVTNFLTDNVEARINQLQKDLYSKILELQNNINQLQKDSRTATEDIQTQTIAQIQIQTKEINKLKTELNQLRTEVQTRIEKEIQSSTIKTELNQVRTDIQSQVQTEIIRLTTELNSIKVETQSQIESEVIRLNTELNSLKTEIQSQIQNENLNLIQQQIKAELTPIVQNQTFATNIQSTNQIQPDVSPIIQNQTSVTNLNSIVENIQNQVDNVLNTTIRNFSKDYQDKIKGFDDVRPNNVLSKFLDLYRTSIGFVNFFGDNKNTKTIEKNLKALRKIFTDSFEVAAVLRQTIIKIVNQLSNLPTASPSSGGLNLDIEVPGGRLRQAGGSRIRNIARAGGIAGAGLLGLGGAAAAMTGMGRAREYQESLLSGGVSAASGEPYIPENIIESFSGIVDRFTSAVNELISGAKRSAGAPGGGGGGGAAPGAAPEGPPGGMSTSATQGTPQQKALLDAIAFAEGTQKSYGTISGGDVNVDLEQGKLTVRQVIALGNTYGTPGSKHKWSGATGRYQFMPKTLQMLIDRGVLKVDEPFTPQKQDEAALWLAYNRGVTPELLAKEGISSSVANKLAPEWASFPTFSGRSYYGQSVKSLADIQRIYSQSLNSPQTKPQQPPSTTPQQPAQPPQPPRVTPAPTPAQTIQARAQTISQPAQQVPQTISLPPTVIDATGGQQPSQQSSTPPTVPSAPPSPGPEVPFLPTTNPDNFLTMYSRIVYNIVDG